MSRNKWGRIFSLTCVLALSGAVLAYAAEPPNRGGSNNPTDSSASQGVMAAVW